MITRKCYEIAQQMVKVQKRPKSDQLQSIIDFASWLTKSLMTQHVEKLKLIEAPKVSSQQQAPNLFKPAINLSGYDEEQIADRQVTDVSY